MEVTSQIWRGIFSDIRLPKDGVVVEVAPGYEPKIGNALAAIGFCGTIYLIEPDKTASRKLMKIYQQVLPHAKVIAIAKTMQDLKIRIDISVDINAVVASHPFDDMVIGSIITDPDFFTAEKNGGEELASKIKNIYDSLKDTDYARGTRETVKAWEKFLTKVQPNYFIASQYPSHMLTVKGLVRRQESGYAVLNKLKTHYKNFLLDQPTDQSLGLKAGPKWWIAIGLPRDERACK